MSSISADRFSPPWYQPYDPADSPGPIASVIERFRPRPDDDEPVLDDAEIEAARYTVILLGPDDAQALGQGRFEAGLQLYRDTDWGHNPSDLDDAATIIEQTCGKPVSLAEHRSDLTYWTARVRP
nr:hypothetical protein [Micromonospora sp. DSM 115978]